MARKQASALRWGRTIEDILSSTTACTQPYLVSLVWSEEEGTGLGKPAKVLE